MKTPTLLLGVLLTAVLAACSNSPSTPDTRTDQVNPSVTWNSLSTAVTQASEITLSARATDNVGVKQVEFFVDGQLVGTDTTADAQGLYDAPYEWTLQQNGTHTLKVVATDTSGNTSAAEQTVKVNIVPDTVKPEVVIDGLPTSIVTTPGTFTVSGKATDNVGVKSVRMVVERTDEDRTVTLFDQTSGTLTSFTYNVVVDEKLNGAYKVTVTARDAAGNEQVLSKSVMVRIEPPAPAPQPDPTPTPPTPPTPTPPTPTPDTTPPTISITAPTATITQPGPYDITISVADNVGVTQVSGYVKSNTLGTQPLTGLSTSGGTVTMNVSKLYNGTHTLYVTATDAAGNTSSAQASVTVAIP